MLDDEEKRSIVGRSRTLLERISDESTYEPHAEQTTDPEKILDEWEELFPDEKRFSARLERDGVTRDDCLRAISRDKLVADEPLPRWVGRLEQLVHTVQSHDPSVLRARCRRTDDEMNSERPFAELSAAVADHARNNLADVVKTTLSEESIDSLVAWFRDRFESRYVRVFYVEFKYFLSERDPDLVFADSEEFDEISDDWYEAFVDHLFDGGFEDLCSEYPVFARLVVDQLRQWDELVTEFAQRLEADKEELAETYNRGVPLETVTTVEPLAEDTHADGRAVLKVVFEAGVTVVYKPRSVETEAKFYEVLRRLDEQLPTPDFTSPEYLVREAYGWMDWIEYRECEDEEAVKRYYQRAGALVCICYLFNFEDVQFENLVVHGEYPLVIDAETVFAPYMRMDGKPELFSIPAALDDSVLLTLLLPFRVEELYRTGDRGDLMTKVSGLSVSGTEATVEEITKPEIGLPNTDLMSVEHEPISVDRSENIPRVDGEERPPAEFLQDILDGFETTYETVLRLRDNDELFSIVNMETALESTENRFIYRDTSQYIQTIRSLCSQACLSDGVHFGLELENLAVPFYDGRVSDSDSWNFYGPERRALRTLDVPRFTSEVDSDRLYMRRDEIDVGVDLSGKERFRNRVRTASRADMHEQKELVRLCFEEERGISRDGISNSPSSHEAATDDRLETESRSLFERVRESGVTLGGDDRSWASVDATAAKDHLSVRPVGASLRNGRCGVGVFGAGLYAVTGENEYRRFALETVRPVREAIVGDKSLPSLQNHGGAVGIGSVLYGLSVIGTLIDEESLLDEAITLANVLPDDRSESVEADVSNGLAGTMLGLLAAYDRTGDSGLLRSATVIGDRLLDSRVEVRDGVQIWDSSDSHPPLTGFAHGVSGIAYSLLRLGETADAPRYCDAAIEALAYERSAYSEADGNWPDFRDSDGSTYLDAWCHGRTGIGLARLGMESYTSHESVSVGIERACENFPMELAPEDNLCCGNAGRTEFLLEANRRGYDTSGNPRDLLAKLLARKSRDGGYTLPTGADVTTDPTLFDGIAGIGYTTLRVIDPETLPCLLRWE